MENVRESGPVPEIVGRERELARIAGVLDAVDSRGGVGAQVLALTAEPGAGKSTLVDWAAARAASRGFQVLRARAGEGEEGFGFAGLHQLLRPLLGRPIGCPPRSGKRCWPPSASRRRPATGISTRC